MRSRCVMCANALAAFAGENRGWEPGRGKSVHDYVAQSQTLFCSYCKRPRPPLWATFTRSQENFESDSKSLRGQTGFFLSLFPSRIVRSVYWAASVPGSGARQGEGAGRGAHGTPRVGLQSPWPSEAAGAGGRSSPRGCGRPPPWAESSTLTLCGCSGVLGTLPNSVSGR